jgi:type I restriction enzyme R subunit
MSALLDTLMRERQSQALEYKEYLDKIAELARQAQNPTSGTTYPDAVNTLGKRAIYDRLEEYDTSKKNDEIANTLDTVIRNIKQDGWRGKPVKEKEIRLEIRKVLKKAGLEKLENDIFQLILHQTKEY